MSLLIGCILCIHVPINGQLLNLQDEYRIAFTTDSWRRRMGVGGGQWVMIHSEEAIRHFRGTTQASDWFTADTISDCDGMEGVPGPSDKLLEVKSCLLYTSPSPRD